MDLRHPKTNNNRQGFIALITAMILSAILMVVTVALNQSSFFARSALLDSEYKEKSTALVESCLNTAILKLAVNPAYAGGETIPVQTDSCVIRPVQIDVPVAGQDTIETSAVFREASSNLRVIINAAGLSIISWDEVPGF